jgi:hypothetical protein
LIRAAADLRSGRPAIFQEMQQMKNVPAKDTPEISGGSLDPFVTDAPLYPNPDYPQSPINDPLGEDDLPVGSR